MSKITEHVPIKQNIPTDNILGHKAHPSTFKRIVFIWYLFSEHKGIKLKVNNRTIAGNLEKYVELKQQMYHTSKRKSEFLKYFYLKKLKIQFVKIWDTAKVMFSRKYMALNSLYSKFKINHLSFHLEKAEKEEIKHTSRKKITKIRSKKQRN